MKTAGYEYSGLQRSTAGMRVYERQSEDTGLETRVVSKTCGDAGLPSASRRPRRTKRRSDASQPTSRPSMFPVEKRVTSCATSWGWLPLARTYRRQKGEVLEPGV